MTTEELADLKARPAAATFRDVLALVAEVERLKLALHALARHCKAHEDSARLVGQTAWWVATVPDPLEQARAALSTEETQLEGCPK
jgi:hypothetical protein